VVLLDGWQAADTVAGKNPYPISIGIGYFQTGIVMGHDSGRYCILNEQFHMLGDLLINEVLNNEVLDLGRDLHWIIAGVKPTDQVNTTATLTQTFPGLLNTDTQWGNQTSPGNYNSSTPLSLLIKQWRL
jgi:hypothetical protein